MEQIKPAQVEIKVTWSMAWSLWWRWMLMSIALGAIIYIPLILILFAIGITDY